MSDAPDPKDKAILAALRVNAKATIEEIAALTQVPATTVHQRIKRMERDGIILGYRAIINDAKVGLGMRAMVMLNAGKNLQQQISVLEAVRRVVAVVGEYDYLVEIVGPTLDEIHLTLRYLKRIDGVSNVRAFMVLEQH